MSRVSKTVASNNSSGLSLDSTFTWNCKTESWVWSPTKNTTAYAKDIRCVIVRSDLFKIGGSVLGRNAGRFGSKYGCRGKKLNGLSVNAWFKPDSGAAKNLGKVNWWDVKDRPEFEKSNYNNIIAVKMISYKIVEDGKERDSNKDDPQFVGLRIKGHSWKLVQDAVQAFKAALISEGKAEDASQISTDELELCFLAYLSDALVQKSNDYGSTYAYPVPKFSLLGEKQAGLEKEALALYHEFDDQLSEYLRSNSTVVEEDDANDDVTPPSTSTPPPPPTQSTQSQASSADDDLPF